MNSSFENRIGYRTDCSEYALAFCILNTKYFISQFMVGKQISLLRSGRNALSSIKNRLHE